MKGTHKTRLLTYLKDYGSITSLQAIQDLGNTRLAASIFLLRDDGHLIQSKMIIVPTRWGGTTSVARYIYINKIHNGNND
jgi:hypothetical protein